MWMHSNSRLINCFIVQTVLFCIFVTTTAYGQDVSEDKTVYVIGTAAMEGKNADQVRKLAISNGFVAAVDQVSLETLPPEAMITHFKQINETVHRQNEKYIQNYKVLSELSDQNDYRVLLQITLSEAGLKNDLSSFIVKQEPKSNLPKILLFISEKQVGDSKPMYWWSGETASDNVYSQKAMMEALSQKGFDILNDPLMAHDIVISDIIPKPDLTSEEALAKGTHFKADIVIVGNGVVYQVPNTREDGTRSFNGTVTARALSVETGEEIAGSMQTSVKMHTDETEGMKSALYSAGLLAAQEISTQLGSIPATVSDTEKQIKIDVVGTQNLGNFVLFRRTLTKIEGVKEIRILEMRPNEAAIDVDFAGDKKALSDALMLKTFDNFGLNIYDTGENRLRIELNPK